MGNAVLLNIGYGNLVMAARVVSIGTIVFLGIVVFIFWLNGLDGGRGGLRGAEVPDGE